MIGIVPCMSDSLPNNYPQHKPVLFHNKLAITSQFFGGILNADGTVAMVLAGCYRETILKKRRLLTDVFYAQEGFLVAVFQHQMDFSLIRRKCFLGMEGIVQCVDQDGGK